MQQNKLHVSQFVARFKFFETIRLIGAPKNMGLPFGEQFGGVRAKVPSDPVLRWLCR